ncbi:MAG: hypothetical protein CM1200mP41_35090 [Gammaproteobacteria bacterium]|nr:MAG: hypothetical protein CM1200mP41_35090 [Gammaproteobacteria bacterium]
MAFYELRQYTIKPGKMAEWLTLMEGEIIPFQMAQGMVSRGVLGERKTTVFIFGCVVFKAKKSARRLCSGL